MPSVEVPDIPRETRLELPAQRTALIVVDMQNDFVHEDGALHVPDAAASVPRIRDLLGRAREAGVRVVFTQDWHEEDDPEFDVWPRHVVRGSWGAEIVDGLDPDRADLVVRKPRYDAFYATGLDHALRVWAVTHLLVVGTVANICVQHTAASGALRWYRVATCEDAISALDRFDLLATLRQLTFLYTGQVASSDAVVFRPADGG
jgi:nicotinamidase-related amidase